MVSGWKQVPISEVGRILSGGTPSTKIAAYWDGHLAWCTPSDITEQDSKYISSTERRITQLGLDNSSATLLPEGTILLCSRATIGEMAIAASEITTNQGFKNIICNDGYDTEFVYYALHEVKQEMVSKSFGSTFLEISKKELGEINLQIPETKAEQKIISAALSDVDELILNLEKLIEKKTAIKQGAMQKLMSGEMRLSKKDSKWTKVVLGDVCKIKSQMVDPRLSEYARLPHIGNESIDKHTGHLLEYRTVLEDGLISGKYYFTDNDVLYGKINPQFGKVAFPRFSGLCSADMYPISCGDAILPSYLKYVLLTYDFLNYSISLSMRSGMPKINRKELYGYEWDLPPKDEQEEIAKTLDDMDSEIIALTLNLDKYRGIKVGMMNELLTGRTRLI